MIYNDDGDIQNDSVNENILNEQMNILLESGLLTKISNKAKDLLRKGKAIFKRRLKKVIDKDSGEEVTETTTKNDKKEK